MKKLQILLALALAVSVTTAGAAGKSAAAQAAKPGPSTIVSLVLADDGEFDVLQAAVIKAGLVDALNGKKQLTVFAPTDAAFIKTLEVADEVEALATIDALPVDVLQQILLYHVINGRRISTSVLAAPQYQTLNGKKLSRAELVAAGLGQTDISASNGVIHVIDSVLLP